MKKRVVITGTGAITPVGNDIPTFWNSLMEGKTGIDLIKSFDTADFPVKFGAEVKNFDPEQYIGKKEVRRMDRFVQYAIAAATQAVEQAKLNMEEVDANRVAVIVGSGIGGIETFEKQALTLAEKGPGRVSPFFIPMMIADLAAGEVSIRFGAKGINYCPVSACASGAHAIGEAFKAIQRGDADAAITGGTEASVTPLALAGFASMKALSTRNEEPLRACRPFDMERDGFVLGEGSGIIVLEELEHAKKRGATILAEIVGYGATGDAHHITAPAPGGDGIVRSMSIALKDADLTPDAIDYINAHGTSTPLNDKTETAAIKTVFGDHARKLAISSTKSMTGHLLGASGAVEFLALTYAIINDMLPPTINYENPDPECDLDYVPNKARPSVVTCGLSNSLGFGGHNVSLVVKKYSE